jgi:hypothetical protein
MKPSQRTVTICFEPWLIPERIADAYHASVFEIVRVCTSLLRISLVGMARIRTDEPAALAFFDRLISLDDERESQTGRTGKTL